MFRLWGENLGLRVITKGILLSFSKYFFLTYGGGAGGAMIIV
jgi:hypothetical protein